MTESRASARSGPLVGTVLGRYTLTRWLGEGGMGAVYEAQHRDLGKRAAIKTLHERCAASPEARQRFLREGRAAAQIRHSNVADVYDVGIEEHVPYLVMELLEGEDLGRLLSQKAPLTPQHAADLLVPVVAAVAAAHDLGIVHRDLKPENIFLTQDRTGTAPKVLDFGISKLSDGDAPSVTGTGAVLGTPHYMSPEQAQGDKQVDARSDQYALGVILYQCVTGRRPLQGLPLYALIQKTVHGDFPPPRQLQPSVPRAFEELILRAMARQPSRRFPDTRELGAALLAFASDAVRTAYARELTGSTSAAQRAPSASGAAAELPTTLGESAHVRAVPTARRPLQRRAALLGALLLAGPLLWRLGRGGSADTPAPLEAATQATEAREQAASAEVSPPLALQPPPSVAVASAPVAPAGTEPSALRRHAEALLELWRRTPLDASCSSARELWLEVQSSARSPEARAAAERALASLGECTPPAPRAPARMQSSAPAAERPTLPAARRAPSVPALPSEDPDDGFVDLAPGTEAR